MPLDDDEKALQDQIMSILNDVLCHLIDVNDDYKPLEILTMYHDIKTIENMVSKL